MRNVRGGVLRDASKRRGLCETGMSDREVQLTLLNGAVAEKDLGWLRTEKGAERAEEWPRRSTNEAGGWREGGGNRREGRRVGGMCGERKKTMMKEGGSL